MSDLEFERDAVLPFEETSFDVKVRRVIERMLREPTSLPEEFKGWLPSHMETANMQVPVSQIVGNFLVEDSTTKMGGDVHGRPGTVRGGASPYEFYKVTFDKVYDKWVSDQFLVAQQTAADTTTSATYETIANTTTPLFAYEALVDAGLKPQFKLDALILSSSGAQTHSASLALDTWDDGDAFPSGSVVSWSISTTNTTGVLKSSGWQDHGLSLADKDHLVVAPVHKVTGGATGTTTGLNLWLRWVSV